MACNRRTRRRWATGRAGGTVPTASYNANHQQLAFGEATMIYDLNGNLATLTDAGGTTTYTWNPRNQLTGLAGPGLTASFGYDALGRRRTKTVNGAQMDSLFDGLNPVQEGQLPVAPTANLLTGLGLDEVLIRTDGAGQRAFLVDALGSPIALADDSGTVQTEYTYAPFGATTSTGQTNTNPFKFTGREDDGTGVYYYRARYYSPALHRFIREDPLGFDGGSVNFYRYVGNNPLRYVDALGLWATNNSDSPWFIKPEERDNPVCLLPPGVSYPGPVDGAAPADPRSPSNSPPWWFKVSDGTNISIGKNGVPRGVGGPPIPEQYIPDWWDKAPGYKWNPGWEGRHPDWRPHAPVPPCERRPPGDCRTGS